MIPQQTIWLRYLGTATLLTIVLGISFGAALVYQYDNLLFLTSSQYAAQAFSLPGGAAEYLAAIWAELCSAPWAGAVATGLLLALGGVGMRHLAYGAADRWSLGYIAPWVVTMGVFDPHFLIGAVTWLLVVGWSVLWVRGTKARASIAGVVVLLAYFSGGAMAMILATGLVLARLLIDRQKVLWVAVVVAVAAVTPLIGAYIYGISIDTAYHTGVALSWWVVVFSILTVVVGSRTIGKKEPKFYWTWVSFGVVTLCGVIGLWSERNPRLDAMMRIEQASDRGQWTQVAQMAETFEQQHGANRMVTFLRNTALWRQGKLLARLFDVPQPYGPQGLFYEWNENQGAKAIVGAKLSAEGYRNAGLLWQAHRLTYEAMAGLRPTRYTLCHLEAYNRALGRHKAADRFEHLLNHSLRDELEVVLPQATAGCDSVSSESGNLVRDLEQVVAADTTHHEALEYLTAIYLSAGHTQGILGLADRWNGRPIPEAVQEALLAAGHNFTPDGRVVQKFQRFIAQLQNGQGNPRAISSDLHNTYWFYTLCLAQQRRQG